MLHTITEEKNAGNNDSTDPESEETKQEEDPERNVKQDGVEIVDDESNSENASTGNEVENEEESAGGAVAQNANEENESDKASADEMVCFT